MKNKHLSVIGAGRLGKGFIGVVFGDAGWKIHFLDKDRDVIDRLIGGPYEVEFHAADRTYKRTFHEYDASLLDEEHPCMETLSASELWAMSLYPQDFEQAVQFCMLSLKARLKQGLRTTVLAFTNKNYFADRVAEMFTSHLDPDERKLFAELAEVKDVIIIRGTTAASASGMKLETVETMKSLVQTTEFADLSEVPWIKCSENVPTLKYAKLFALNSWHAAAAYTIHFLGGVTMDDFTENELYGEIVNGVKEHSAMAIQKEFSLTEEELTAVRTLVFPKDNIRDTVKRVGCEPIRKLSNKDRLVYPAQLCEKYGIDINPHAKAVALGFLYDDETDQESVELQSFVCENGIEKAVASYCGLQEDSLLFQKICEYYRQYAPADRNRGKLYRIEPVLEQRIWGGRGLIEKFSLKTELENVAEYYFAVAIPGRLDCRVTEAGMPLSAFYLRRKELFGIAEEQMPVRLATGDAVAPLSIQVHPNDKYALEHEGMLGKPDGEFYLGNGKGTMVLGHYAKTMEEFRQWTEEKNWEKLFRIVDIQGGDFIHMPEGTLHGSTIKNWDFKEVKPGTRLEPDGAGQVVAFARNGDVTYRLYDYDRVDKEGNPRPMHINEVYDTVTVPDDQILPVPYVTHTDDKGCSISRFYDEPKVYTAGRIQTVSEGSFCLDGFYFLSCVEGEGKIENKRICAGQTLFIPREYGPVSITGTLDLMYISYRNE